ncbi:DUF560 domain-containing protein [Croceicoccus ponticola]|uniref:DUF560 domain-containing protein n=1 Tax=Croceicoccus ponticola TaxID=2217664 RepID=A0A437GUJ5_9SPHN|nr:surface lipoprotein assembly modifier [Croceicoccus ponticola]RVQ65141.1 DUF560 domain-containing protein [Croceicoccus ponticola]
MQRRDIRSGVACRMLAMALACGSATFPEPSRAQDASAEQTSSRSIDDIVDALVRQGKADDAAVLLDAIIAATPDDQQAHFLRGLVATSQGDYRKAIAIFRAILIDHPEAVRVRLELARAFFLDRDYQNADRQFRAVRAGDLPPTVKANVDAFLFQIRQSKNWSYGLSVALAPDTNLNAASTSREVAIYGLPFKLSDDARKKSGIGAAVDANVEWAPRIAPNGRLRIGTGFQRREYGGSTFDDMTLSAQIGPRFVFPRWDVSLLGTGFRRWYGGNGYAKAAGGRMEAIHYAGSSTVISGSLGALHLDYDQQNERDGWVYNAGLGLMRQLDQTSAASLKLGVNRQDADAAAYRNWSGIIGAGYFRELPEGFSVYIEPSYAFAKYDAALPAFPEVRSDKIVSATAAVLNRRIVLSRFTPRIAYTFTHMNSSINLYDYDRHRIEVGLTTAF